MNHAKSLLRGAFAPILALLLAFGCAASASTAQATLPGDSLYRLDFILTDQDGHAFTLAERRGKPLLVSMFYTSCRYVCPLIIDTVLKTEHELSPAQRDGVQALLVSFDPDRDTPELLKRVSDKRKLKLDRWTLARTDAANVRKLAAALGVQYRELPDGEFNHASAVILLDAEGRILARTAKLGEADPEFVAAVRKALDRHGEAPDPRQKEGRIARPSSFD